MSRKSGLFVQGDDEFLGGSKVVRIYGLTGGICRRTQFSKTRLPIFLLNLVFSAPMQRFHEQFFLPPEPKFRSGNFLYSGLRKRCDILDYENAVHSLREPMFHQSSWLGMQASHPCHLMKRQLRCCTASTKISASEWRAK